MTCAITLEQAHGPLSAAEALVVAGYATECTRESGHEGDHWFSDGSHRTLHCTGNGFLAIYPY